MELFLLILDNISVGYLKESILDQSSCFLLFPSPLQSGFQHPQQASWAVRSATGRFASQELLYRDVLRKVLSLVQTLELVRFYIA